jgi:hypothetical protein
MFSHSLLYLFLQHLSKGSVSEPMFQAEVTQAWEVATDAEAAHIAVVLDAETSS